LCWDKQASNSNHPHPKLRSDISRQQERHAGSDGQLPLPLAGEGWGEGGRAQRGALASANATGIQPAVVGEFTLPDGRKAVPVFQRIVERYLDPQYAPDAVAERCGIDADTIR